LSKGVIQGTQHLAHPVISPKSGEGPRHVVGRDPFRTNLL